MITWRTDEELMLRYRDGDAAAFETLYRRYEKPFSTSSIAWPRIRPTPKACSRRHFSGSCERRETTGRRLSLRPGSFRSPSISAGIGQGG